MLSSRFTLHASRFTLHASRFTLRHVLAFLLCLVNVLFCTDIIKAQPVNNLVKDVVMPAPNAASLGKYGDIPVSYFTGVPNIGVPIHTVQEGSLSLPISLNYHASGTKVAETASWVGMGWSLSAGGMITRTVLGKPDDQAGYYTNGNQVAISLATMENVVAGLMDSEPDIFNFNVNGYSGKFYFDKDQVAQIVPKQNVKIIPTHVGSEFTSFTLIVPDGTRFIFGQVGEIKAQEQTTVYSDENAPQPIPYISSWYLLKMETSDKNYAINLAYEDENYSFANKASNSKTKSFCAGGDRIVLGA